MHSMFQGTLGFGLVSIPIQMFKAMDDEHIALHWVHAACRSRIRYQKFCPRCQRMVESDELSKAYQLADGRLVPLEAGNPAWPLPPEAENRNIGIVAFHRLDDVDPILYRTAYWLKPAAGGSKAYRLLLDAMDASGLIAVAQMVLRTKPSLALIRPIEGSSLVLHVLYYPESLRSEGLQFGRVEAHIAPKEQELALQLVTQMTEPFDPRAYPNQTGHAFLERIRALAETVPPPTAESLPEDLLALMERLKASLEETGASAGRG